jgi:hypothetical protein
MSLVVVVVVVVVVVPPEPAGDFFRVLVIKQLGAIVEGNWPLVLVSFSFFAVFFGLRSRRHSFPVNISGGHRVLKKKFVYIPLIVVVVDDFLYFFEGIVGESVCSLIELVVDSVLVVIGFGNKGLNAGLIGIYVRVGGGTEEEAEVVDDADAAITLLLSINCIYIKFGIFQKED